MYKNSILAIFVLLIFAGIAQADPKISSVFGWGFGFYPYEEPTKPLLETGKHPHHIQWEFDNENWSPEEWVELNGGSKEQMLARLKAAAIVTGQSERDNIPVLEVGQPFLRLSGLEKHRVAAFIDYMYGVTAEREDGMFIICRKDMDIDIGYYTKYGLQLQ